MSDDDARRWARPEAPDLSPAPAPASPGPASPAPDASGGAGPDLPYWWIGFAGLLLGLAVALVGASVAATITGSVTDPSAVIAGTWAQNVGFFAIAFGFARIGSGVAPRVALGLVRPASPGAALGLAAAAWVGFLVLSTVYGLALGIENASEETVEALGLRESTANLVFSGIAVAVLAPIVEEVFFRGLLFGALWRRFGWLIGAFGSAVTFGMLHFGGAVVEALPVLAALGFLLAWLYRRTGSLVPCIAVHAVNNAIALGYSADSLSDGARVGVTFGAIVLTTSLSWLICVPARSVLRTP